MRRWLSRNQRRAQSRKPLFALGELGVTPGAQDLLRQVAIPVCELLKRHQRGDWGQVDEVDMRQNALGVRLGLRIRSAYDISISRVDTTPDGVLTITSFDTVWIVTSPDRRRTTVFLPREIFDEQTLQD
ncbi:MAG: hypothetical protein EOP24_42140 [Hyphomicrobiales bacterium]|nr:MAG: hypothetical protein EOP24_42140 [Hyphomicrobiales bacterium]